VNLQVLDRLDPAQQSAVAALIARCEEADQHPALSEDLRDPAGRIDLIHHGARAVLAPQAEPAVHGEMGGEMGGGGQGELAGCATLTPGADGLTSLHLAIDPAHRGSDLRTTLIAKALAHTSAPVRLWIMLAGRDDDEGVAPLGFRPERDLLQMRVPLPLAADIVAATRTVETRSFVVGQDDETWLSVNNRAFAGHPEQGNWTLEKLRGREQAEWFDPHGFLLAPEPNSKGRGLIGSCWTKVHRHQTPVLGEIYVISVDPARHGEGWGRALTVAGLEWLSGQGLSVGMLYTDASNTTAVALYRSLGFTVDHVDRSYLRSAS
jgi:mycothiol synthase